MARLLRPREAEEVSWPDLLDSLSWSQGEHVSLIGPTDAGKTTLALELVAWRAAQSPRWHATVVSTKPADEVLARTAKRAGWPVVREWPPPWGAQVAMLWPRWRGRRDNASQRAAIRGALDAMLTAGHRAVVADEAAYWCRKLGLADDLRDWWQQGRSLGLSLVACTQRPAWVPLDLYSAPHHLFVWRTNDATDLRRLTAVGGGLDTAPIRRTVATLPEHNVLYVNTRTGRMARTAVTRRITR